MRLQSVFVLRFSRHIESFSNQFTGTAHVLIIKRAPQTVLDYRIQHPAVPQPISFARFGASRTTIAPRSVALKLFSAPRNFPTGVRTALMITASLIDDMF